MIRPFPAILIGLAVVSVGAYAAINQYQGEPDVVYPLPVNNASSVALSITTTQTSSAAEMISSASASSVKETAAATSTPGSVKIDVPFQSQAPLANWDALHQEACEEASLILVQQYLKGAPITPQGMEDEIQALIKWETEKGYAIDVTMAELGKIAEDYYGLKATVMTDVSVESIKKQIAAGNPVIIPAAGQTLGNPYFSGDGPPYHVLVVTGYDSTHFITNDVGTKRGEDYRYSYQTLVNAIHDWNGSTTTIESGPKTMLVITK